MHRVRATKPHARNLRKGRWSHRGQIYHVTFSTHKRRPVLAHWRAARTVTRIIHTTPGLRTYCHVIMPDHVHWLVGLEGDRTLSQAVQCVKSVSSRRINRLFDRRGRVWHPGFYDQAIRHERSLRDVARYIVANPLRAGLVRRMGDYPHWDACWL